MPMSIFIFMETSTTLGALSAAMTATPPSAPPVASCATTTSCLTWMSSLAFLALRSSFSNIDGEPLFFPSEPATNLTFLRQEERLAEEKERRAKKKRQLHFMLHRLIDGLTL